MSIISDIWTVCKETPLTDNFLKRTAVATLAMPLVNFGLSYLGGTAIGGQLPGNIGGFDINPQVNEAATAAAGWLGIELLRGSYNLCDQFVKSVKAAGVDREFKKSRAKLLSGVEKEIVQIVREIGRTNHPPVQELTNLLAHFEKLKGDLQGEVIDIPKLAELTDSFHRLKDVHDLTQGIWGLLTAQGATAAANPFRAHLADQVPDQNTPIESGHVDSLTLLKRQLSLNLGAQVKKELDELQEKIDDNLATPGKHPDLEYGNLKTHFQHINNGLQNLKTSQELDGLLVEIERLKKVKARISEIWDKLKAQNIPLDGTLRTKLTDNVPAHGNAIGDAQLAALSLLRNQLELRQNANTKVKELKDIQSRQTLLRRLQFVRNEKKQLDEKNSEIGKLIGELNNSSQKKPLGFNTKSPRELLQERIDLLKQEAAVLTESFVGMDYFTHIQETIELFQAQPQSLERDQQISHLQQIVALQTQIQDEIRGLNRPQIIQGYQKQIQEHLHLKIENLDALIEGTQIEIDNLPKPANIGALIQKFRNFGTSLDAVQDQNGYNNLEMTYRNAVAQIPAVVQIPRPNPIVPNPAPIVLNPAPIVLNPAPILPNPAPILPNPAVAVPNPAAPVLAAKSEWYKNRILQVAGAAATVIAGGVALLSAPSLVKVGVAATVAVGGLHHFRGRFLRPKPQPQQVQQQPKIYSYDALGKVADPFYQGKTKSFTKKQLKFDFHNTLIEFNCTDVHRNTAASLQLLANVQPLMRRLGTEPLTLVERDLFTEDGIAMLGKQNLELNDERKKAALHQLATMIHAEGKLDEDEVLKQLRQLTHDGKLGAIRNLKTQPHKLNIARLLVRLELRDLYQNKSVDRDKLDSLVRAANILKACFDDAENRLEPILGADGEINPETLITTLIRAIDHDQTDSKITESNRSHFNRKSNVVLIRNENFSVESTNHDLDIGDDTVSYRVVGTIERNGKTTRARVLKGSGWSGYRWNTFQHGSQLKTEAGPGILVGDGVSPHPSSDSPFQPKITILVPN